MPFILPPNTLTQLNFVRSQYQEEKQLDLAAPPSVIGRPIWLGGTDVVRRAKQIEFLEKIHTILKPNLFQEAEISTPAEWQANLTASRIMIAAALYVKSQIAGSKRNSVLYRLIDEDLGISKENYLDEEDEEICCLAARRLMTSSLAAFDEANNRLRAVGLSPFSERDWASFIDFLCAKTIKNLAHDPYANYPITSVTQRLFGTVFAYTGATLGVLSGETLSHSTQALSTKTQLTAFVGGTLLVFGAAGPAGVALFAPAIAERLITAFCSISLAHILGVTMGIVGQGVGIGVGIPLDIAYKLLCGTCTVIGAYSLPTHKQQLTGTRIKDGMTVFQGIPIEITARDSVPAGCTPKMIEIKYGKLYLDNKEVVVPETGIKLPPEVIAKLNRKARVAAALCDVDAATDEDQELKFLDTGNADNGSRAFTASY